MSPGTTDGVGPLVCPGRPLADLPGTHPLYSVAFKLSPAAVPLRAASNGSRLLVVLSPDDHAGAWQARSDKTRPASFQLAANLFAYATGNVPPRNRLDTAYVEPADGQPLATFAVARVRYGANGPDGDGGHGGGAGDWDPEPGAWERFARLFRWQTGAAVDVRPVAAADLGTSAAPLAHLTGSAAPTLTPADVAGLRAYVGAGGVLLVDACGGGAAFADAAERVVLPAAFPGMAMEPADPKLAPLARTQR
jgi:hypothetical protein